MTSVFLKYLFRGCHRAKAVKRPCVAVASIEGASVMDVLVMNLLLVLRQYLQLPINHMGVIGLR